jgi:hypothetical protein
VLIIPSSWGSQLVANTTHIKLFSGAVAGIEEEEAPTSTTRHQSLFWRRCRGERGFMQGESLTSNLFTLLLFCLVSVLYFCLHLFYQKYKK